MAETLLESKFAEVGLEVAYWKDIFQSQFAVTTIQQLQNLGLREYNVLKKCSRHEWENIALKKLLCVEAVGDTDSEKKRLEDAKKFDDEFKELHSSGKDKSENLARKKKEELMEKSKINSDHRHSKFEKDSCEESISNLNSVIFKSENLITKGKSLTPVEVIEHASAGQALRGVLVVGQMEDNLQLCNPMIQAPCDMKFKGASIPQFDRVKEFFTESEQNDFLHFLQSKGYNAAIDAKVGGWVGMQAEASYSHKNDDETTFKSKTSSQNQFYSRVMLSFVPISSF